MPENDEAAKSTGVTMAKPNLAYVSDMLRQLHSVSEAEGADMLSYLIEMAFIECDDILSNSRPLNLGFQNKRNKSS